MRKIEKLFFLLCCCTVCCFAQAKTATGFYYPIGKSPSSSDTWWLECNSSYYAGKCHLGHDFVCAINTPVCAIADGEVLVVSYNGWEIGNIAVLIKHTLINGVQFLGLYGHLKINSLKKGDKVYAGRYMGNIGDHPNGIHLHFGIFPTLSYPSTGWGKMASPATSPYNGLVDPISWIQTKIPSKSVLSIAYEYNFSNHSSQGWSKGWDVVKENGVDQNTWQLRVNGPNPGMISPEFTKTLKAKSTIMEFSIKARGTNVNPAEIAKIWVKDEGGSWNNPISLKLYNFAHNYNDGNFKPGDYNVYYVDFHDIRAPIYVNQYGELEIKQFSIELTDGAGRPNEYWAIDWLKIYSKNGNGSFFVAGGGNSQFLSGNSSQGTPVGNNGSSNPPPPEPKYKYSNSYTCEGIIDGSVEWSREPVNIKTNFIQGENAYLLVEFNDISVNHSLKVDIYKNDVFSWTWGGVDWSNPGANTWDYSYANVCQTNVFPGEYEFKIFIDTGDGFKQIDSKKINVESSGPSFFYSGAWICEQIDDGPITWSKKATNSKTYFKSGDDINLLVEYKNIVVDHRHKVDIYHNGQYSWTWGGTTWANVGGGWGYSYATPCQSNASFGEYEFKISIDTGTGFEQIDSKTCTVEPLELFDYGGAWTCPSFTAGSEPFSNVPVDPRDSFSQSENIWLLLEMKNIVVDHRFKMELYCNDVFWWDYTEDWRYVGQWGWGYSYFSPCQGATGAGNYEFRVFLDIGEGFELFESKTFVVN